MDEYFFMCPYCWQHISMLLELYNGTQQYVEDCEICCNPIEITYTVEHEQIVAFEATQLE